MAHRSWYIHMALFYEMYVLECQSKWLSFGFLIIKTIVAKQAHTFLKLLANVIFPCFGYFSYT